MIYHSTRNRKEALGSREAVLKGLCTDGGLFVSDRLREFPFDCSGLLELSYRETAGKIFSFLMDDYSREELSDCIEKAYGKSFSCEGVTPLTRIGGAFLLELYHGPTSAFKDVALCMLPQLMSKALSGSGKKLMIVTATSGDTGKAALHGFCDVENIGITVFYPHEKVSDIQYLQMATQEGSNTAVCAVYGNFDDAQSSVKEIFASELPKALSASGIFLSSANSINIGRLVPQIVYYFDAYRQLLKAGEICCGAPVDFCVPTGNFGDVLAGYYAKLMGLPVRKLIVASNENNVLTEFLETGVYDRRRPFKTTISPSMDILISSNLERMLYEMSGGNCEEIAGLMRDLKETGRFSVSGELLSKIREVFDCGCADEAETREAIRRAYRGDHRLIDPHTAVGYHVMKQRGTEAAPCVLLSTASPFKFCRDVYEALFGLPEGSEKDGFWYMDALSEKTGELPPAALSSLRSLPIRHRDVIETGKMKDYVRKKAGAMLS